MMERDAAGRVGRLAFRDTDLPASTQIAAVCAFSAHPHKQAPSDVRAFNVPKHTIVAVWQA